MEAAEFIALQFIQISIHQGIKVDIPKTVPEILLFFDALALEAVLKHISYSVILVVIILGICG